MNVIVLKPYATDKFSLDIGATFDTDILTERQQAYVFTNGIVMNSSDHAKLYGTGNKLLPDTFVYDSKEQVVESITGDVTTSYTYDIDGAVLTESRLGVTKTYQYEGGKLIGSTISEE